MPSQTPSTTKTGSAPWSWKGGALGRACPAALDWRPTILLLCLPCDLASPSVGRTWSRPLPPPLQPDLPCPFTWGHACSFLHHRQDGELPGDTHTTSFTTEASPWSWVWGQLLPRPVTHARGTDAEKTCGSGKAAY